MNAAPESVPQTATVVDAAAVPRLPRGVRLSPDPARGGWTLLGPERVFRADGIAYEILRRCDGAASVGAIIDDLAAAFSAPREVIARDVEAFLAGLAGKRMVELS